MSQAIRVCIFRGVGKGLNIMAWSRRLPGSLRHTTAKDGGSVDIVSIHGCALNNIENIMRKYSWGVTY